jgi:WXXGXW repeat (2 copies)
MKRRNSLTAGLALALFAGTAMQGCVVVPDQRHYADGVVIVAPPPAREEAIGAAPSPDYVWIAGYWNWVGSRYDWVGGRWAPGRTGYHWVAHQWVRQGDGWRLKSGHWERGSSASIERPRMWSG